MSARVSRFAEPNLLRRLEGLRLLAKQHAGRAGAHTNPASELGDGLEFADHRAYAPGDDPRFIDWPAYARLEKLLVRRFHTHSEAQVAILLDASASMAQPDGAAFEHARWLTAALAYLAASAGRPAVIWPFASSAGDPIRLGRNRPAVVAGLCRLDDLVPAGATDLPAACRRVLADRHPPATVILLSDLLEGRPGDLADALMLLRTHCRDLVLLHVFSAATADPPIRGQVDLQDAETGLTRRARVSPAAAMAYRHRWSQFCERLARICRARGGVYLQASSQTPIEHLLHRILPAAGVVS